MKGQKIEELQRLQKQGIITQKEFEEQKQLFLKNYFKNDDKTIKYRYLFNRAIKNKYVVAVILCVLFMYGSGVYGKKISLDIANYVTSLVWQLSETYEGEAVCLNYMQDSDDIKNNKEKIIKDVTKTRQTCACLHNIALKNNITDFKDFIKVISENGKLSKKWIRKKIDGENTSTENTYMKAWMEFWLKDTFTDCD